MGDMNGYKELVEMQLTMLPEIFVTEM